MGKSQSKKWGVSSIKYSTAQMAYSGKSVPSGAVGVGFSGVSRNFKGGGDIISTFFQVYFFFFFGRTKLKLIEKQEKL